MEICGEGVTKYRESETWVVSFSSKNRDRTFQCPGDGALAMLHRRRSGLPHEIRLEQHLIETTDDSRRDRKPIKGNSEYIQFI